MRTITTSSVAVYASVAAALLVGCSPSQTPISGPGAMPQVRVRPASSAYNVLYRFDEYPNGESPSGGLIDVKGTLYGTASGGGVKMCHRNKRGCGTVFSITPSGTEALLYSFNGESGNNPQGPLIGVKGTLYGTTYQGGGDARGTIYSLSSSGSEMVLHSFLGRLDGGQPQAGVIDEKGTLYGTTSGGGPSRDGTVYSYSASGLYGVLYSFLGKSDGAWPSGHLGRREGHVVRHDHPGRWFRVQFV